MLESGGVNNDGWLVQILLPLTDNDGRKFGDEVFAPTRKELTERFGGLTAYLRAPARGLWKSGEGEVAHDDIVIFEVMSETLDAGWWRDYRRRLEERFRQDEIIARAMSTRTL